MTLIMGANIRSPSDVLVILPRRSHVTPRPDLAQLKSADSLSAPQGLSPCWPRPQEGDCGNFVGRPPLPPLRSFEGEPPAGRCTGRYWRGAHAAQSASVGPLT